MSFELSNQEPFAANVRRLVRESLDHVRAVLFDSTSEMHADPEAIHAARKDLKRLRAILRLARADVGESVFGQENQCYRDVGRSLSAARDAAVLMEAFDHLRPKLRELVAPETIANIHDRLQAALKANERQLDLPAAIREVQAARGRSGEWAWLHEDDAWHVPGAGVLAVYRKGRRAMRRASKDDPAEEDFHEWRKQIKLLAAQMRLLYPIQPDRLKAMAKRLDQIAEWLGEEHDLGVLRETLFNGTDGHLGAPAERETIHRLLSVRRTKLRTKALKRGSRLYKEKSARFAARLKGPWKRWRKSHD